jgi:tetratricopeptide (TPR) repeat protein
MHSRLTRLAALLIGVGLGTAACGQYSISNIRSLKAFKDANGLYQRADYRAAIERYEASIAHNPDESNAILGYAYFFLGNSYDNLYKPARKGEAENDSFLPKAVDYYEKAIQQLATPESEQETFIRQRAYEYLIQAYGPEKLDDFDKAVPVARQLIGIQPEEPTFYQALAKMYEDRGDFEEAEKLYLQAIDVRPTDPFGYQILAGYYNRTAEFEKTMEAFRKRADLEPNNPEAWHMMGSFYYEKAYLDKTLPRAKQLEYIEEGLRVEDRALSLNDTYADAMVIKNILLRLQAILERNPARQKALIAQADELHARATKLREAQAAAAPATPAAGGGSN